MGVAGSVIYNILKGRNKPSFDILNKIVSSFDVNPNYLLTGKGNIFISNDETVEITNQRQAETDDDFVYFLKQWDRINNIGKKETHKYFSVMEGVFSTCANITKHYSLHQQAISFLRFFTPKTDDKLLTEQVRKMMEYEEELSYMIKLYETPLAKLYKELDIFNEKQDNVNHMDDEYFENLLKEVDEE